ncbi:hypothetical protein A2415_04390 [candidate division WWE3 bacterium RIFOXYC1_FULL_39_7]|uniref:Uncharacterized protein n=2 Tax=Katanobacteria TaxID=422282 RepID=A0A1F4X8D6_UNCKA|nr:MAG: hypothetical protein A2415_04390 [candidate division WWE3 bacterium RIFOXYC1_FULL_39_7]OGC77944.1 MAG: hypothetical protein A2619_00795 [candidate division WWE3 bacterium RIFOXYD1_FULL_39_9]
MTSNKPILSQNTLDEQLQSGFKVNNLKDIKVVLMSNIPLFVLLAVFIIVLYGNGLGGQFLTADDIPGIVNNPRVQDLQASLKTWELEAIYPAVLFKLFGMTPIPYHIISLILHIINTILVFVFVFTLFGKKTATISSFIFAAHPVNSEAVLWVSAYGYLFLALITFLIITSYTLYKRTTDIRYLYFSAGVFAASLVFYRKPWVLVVPIMVFLIDRLMFEDKLHLKKIKDHFLYWVPAVIYSAVWLVGQYAFRVTSLETLYYMDQSTQTPYLNRVLYTFLMTAKLFIFPSALTIYHEGEDVKSLALFTILTAIATILIGYVTISFLIKSYKDKSKKYLRTIAICIMMIYISILPSFSPKVLVWSSAERYLYPASVFFAVIVAIVLIKLDNKYKNLGVLLGIILTLYSVKVILRTNEWKNSKNLWIATQKISPYSYRVYNNLGDVYAQEKNYPEAIRNFQISLKLSPGFADAVHNLGYTYYEMGNIDLAKQYFVKSLDMNPLLFQSHYKLGVIEYQQMNFDVAHAHFVKALEINAEYEPARYAIDLINQVRLNNMKSLTAPK